MNNTVTRMLTSAGATAVLFLILGALGIELPLWAALLSGFLIGVVLSIVDLAAKRRDNRS